MAVFGYLAAQEGGSSREDGGQRREWIAWDTTSLFLAGPPLPNWALNHSGGTSSPLLLPDRGWDRVQPHGIYNAFLKAVWWASQVLWVLKMRDFTSWSRLWKGL